MTEAQKKIAVVIAAVLIVIPIVLLRSRSALRAERAPINWEEKMKVSVEAKAPAWYRDDNCCHRYDAPPSLPKVRLATIRMWGHLESHDRIVRQKADYQPIRRALYQMGANSSVIEGIDDRVPGIESGYGEIIEAAYLIHAGKVPASYVRNAQLLFCITTEIIPGSSAQEAGLRPGDVLWDVDHKDLLREDTGNCESIRRAMLSTSIGSVVTLSVLRNGSPLDLTLKRPDGLFGYHYIAAPVLDSEKI